MCILGGGKCAGKFVAAPGVQPITWSSRSTRDRIELPARGLFNPLHWFSSTGRTEMAVRFYEETVFDGATFADLKREGGP